jgi:uncharacterized protein (DUF433 family)
MDMSFSAKAQAPPLQEDEDGALRIANTRVLLELVIRAFQDGASPETIVQRYSTLNLPDVYAVIAYYLRNRSEIDSYLAIREEQADQILGRMKDHSDDLSGIRARLLAKRKA